MRVGANEAQFQMHAVRRTLSMGERRSRRIEQGDPDRILRQPCCRRSAPQLKAGIGGELACILDQQSRAPGVTLRMG